MLVAEKGFWPRNWEMMYLVHGDDCPQRVQLLEPTVESEADETRSQASGLSKFGAEPEVQLVNCKGL